jgi:TolA-binding protein
MARAQKLKEQVQTMSGRIKQLETALANVQNGSLSLAALENVSVSDSLQDREPDAVEYERELDDVSRSMGSLAINSEGKAQYYGASAGPEVRSRSPDPVFRLLMSYSS